MLFLEISLKSELIHYLHLCLKLVVLYFALALNKLNTHLIIPSIINTKYHTRITKPSINICQPTYVPS